MKSILYISAYFTILLNQYTEMRTTEQLLLIPERSNLSNLLSIKQIPILCYHNINKFPAKQSTLKISEERLNEQLKMLYDKGFRTILPEQIYQYMNGDAAFPAKFFMLSFDDAHVEQFTIASPILDKYGFKAVFFIPSNYIAKKKLLGRCTNKKIVGPGPYDRRSRL